MLKLLKATALGAIASIMPGRGVAGPVFVGRARTCDVAYTYRMPAGFPGFGNRSHPASIEPCQIDFDDPPTLYGQAVVVDAVSNAVRKVLAGDNALTNVYGFTVRPYPTQQASGGMSSNFADGGPALDQPVDVLRWGYIMTKVNGAPKKGDRVFVWNAASAGDEVQGYCTTVDSANTIPINATFNGPPDADGNVEIIFNVPGAF